MIWNKSLLDILVVGYGLQKLIALVGVIHLAAVVL